MESQPQNPELRINPKNFHLCCLLYTPLADISNQSRCEFQSGSSSASIFCVCKQQGPGMQAHCSYIVPQSGKYSSLMCRLIFANP